MGIYIFNLISILFYSIISSLFKRNHIRINEISESNKNKNKNIKLFIYIIAIQLFVISAFRSVNVGIDLTRYLPRYQLIGNTDWGKIFELRHIVDFEYGYILLNKIISIFYNNEQFFLVVTSLIIVLSFSYFIYNYSRIPWLSFYLFITLGFYGSSFNILRQYIAISILLFSIKYIKNRSLIKFLLCLSLAISIHTTAVFFIILYPLYKKKITGIYIMLLSFSTIILFFLSEKIIKFSLGSTSYSKYLEEIGGGLGNGSGEGMLVILIVVLIFMLIFKKPLEKVDSTNSNLWFNMLILAMFLNILALDLGIFERIMRYFMIALIIAIPNTIYSLKQKDIKLIGTVAVLILCSYYYFGVIMTDYSSSGGIIPYSFMWQKQIID